MNHGSLFSGIGGFDLAAEWMGWINQFHCEWNEFGQRVLKHYWPKATSYADITQTDFTIWRGRIDILTGGFPCQPYSTAGKRKGKEDDRHLWPEMLRAIREIQPRWVVGENVLGLVNWNGGLVFDEVQADLEAEGYDVQPYVLPACGVNAPHRRDRVWFVVYSDKCNDRRATGEDETKGGSQRIQERHEVRQSIESGQVFGYDSNTTSERLEGRFWQSAQRRSDGLTNDGQARDAANANSKLSQRGRGENRCKQAERHVSTSFRGNTWQNFPTQSPVRDGYDGLSERLDGITFPKWRNESIKAGGNAIVPQVALQIFKAIEQYENQNT